MDKCVYMLGASDQPQFVGMILILIFVETLGLYGLIVALILLQTYESSASAGFLYSYLSILFG